MFDNFEVYAELESDSEITNKYVNIGNLLRNRRLDMNLSIDMVSKPLKISSIYMQMVEDGNYKDVAQKIYYFGYIRNISRYLKLDEEIVLRYLVEEIKTENDILNASKNHGNDINILTKSLMSSGKTKINYKSYMFYLLIIVSIITGGFIIKQQSEMKSDSSQLMLRHKNSRSS